MSPVVAWNGVTGTVGRTAIHYFLRRWSDTPPVGTASTHPLELRLTGRSAERLKELAAEVRAAYPQHTVLVFAGCDAQQDPATWPGTPLAEANLLVNTAGPGYAITPLLARYCLNHNVAYVDPSGSHTMIEKIRAITAPPAVTVPLILGAGIQPGLSGLLVRLLARAAGPGATVELYSGGAQPTTEAAVYEFVDSVSSGMVWAGKEWADGKLRPASLPDSYLAQVAATFSPTAVAHAHCDQEISAAATATQAHIVRWYNVSDAPKTTVEIQKMIAGDATIAQVMDAARIDDFGRRHYFRMEGTAVPTGLPDSPLRGTTVNSAEAWHATLECVDSFLVTASVTAIAALYALYRACPPIGAAECIPGSHIRGLPVKNYTTAGICTSGLCLPVDLPDTDYWWQDIMNDPATATTSLTTGHTTSHQEEGELS